MEYTYFVSYNHTHGFGRCEVNRQHEIETIADVLGIEKEINKSNGLTVVVIGYQLMRTEGE